MNHFVPNPNPNPKAIPLGQTSMSLKRTGRKAATPPHTHTLQSLSSLGEGAGAAAAGPLEQAFFPPPLHILLPRSCPQHEETHPGSKLRVGPQESLPRQREPDGASPHHAGHGQHPTLLPARTREVPAPWTEVNRSQQGTEGHPETCGEGPPVRGVSGLRRPGKAGVRGRRFAQ